MNDGAEARESGRLLQSLRHLVAAQEAERRAMGAELHNDLGQMLTALKLILGTPALGHGDEGEEALVEARQLVSEVLERVRDMALRLRPAMLDDLGLRDTLDWYLDNTARPDGLSWDLQTRGLDHRPAPEVETACFRVIQESVTNIVRHSGARTVTVRVEHGSGQLGFEIIDDGEGFNVTEVRERDRSRAGLGLDAMEARLMLLGGELTVASTPGEGTRIHGLVPAGGGSPSEGETR
jgi:signal transduction histidine kinase